MSPTHKNIFHALLLLMLVAVSPQGHGSERGLVVNDVSQLNPIRVAGILTPTSLDEIVTAVKTHRGPISIAGGRYSMGGQTATDGALQIDMRRFDKVIAFSREDREITVQAGIRWRQIQEHIDPYDLSLRIMQTYANFTVGGSLSVNVHGRYIGQGPMILSVKSIRIVLPSGEAVTAGREQNPEIFYGAIGGYGGLGVIVEATLFLTDNIKVERRSEVMPLASYWSHFARNVRGNDEVIFHNADIYPNAFDTVRATSYVRTDKSLTVEARLMPGKQRYAERRAMIDIIADWPGGKWIRQHVVDPWVFRGNCVEWRNYEASYDVAELEPASRRDSTYVLQEYFIPVDNAADFIPKASAILNRGGVNVINISIRHSRQDPGTLLAWAQHEVFAFVLYYKQGTTEADREAVRAWTRQLIDAAISLDGTYYLPYQIIATDEQFHAAYPRAQEYFALKKALDPEYRFRNRLWDAYYRAQ